MDLHDAQGLVNFSHLNRPLHEDGIVFIQVVDLQERENLLYKKFESAFYHLKVVLLLSQRIEALVDGQRMLLKLAGVASSNL